MVNLRYFSNFFFGWSGESYSGEEQCAAQEKLEGNHCRRLLFFSFEQKELLQSMNVAFQNETIYTVRVSLNKLH